MRWSVHGAVLHRGPAKEADDSPVFGGHRALPAPLAKAFQARASIDAVIGLPQGESRARPSSSRMQRYAASERALPSCSQARSRTVMARSVVGVLQRR